MPVPLFASLSLAVAGLQSPQAGIVTGTIRIVAAGDGVTVPARGSFDVWTYSREGCEERCTAFVRDGAWSLETRLRPFRIDVGRMLLDGRPAHVHSSGCVDGNQLCLEAHPMPEKRLTAVASATGEVLPRLALAALPQRVLPPIHLDPAAVLVPTPARLDPWIHEGSWDLREVNTIRWWVRAPGYAWQRIDVDRCRAGDETVTLEPEARIRIEIDGLREEHGAYVFLGLADDPRHEILLVPEPGRALEVEGLPADLWRVKLKCLGLDAPGPDGFPVRAQAIVPVGAGEVACLRWTAP